MNINLDNHTQTKICKTVSDFLGIDHVISSPHSPHSLGVAGFQYLEEALEVLLSKELFGEKKQAYFFSSWQEAVHTLFMAFYINEITETGKNQILVLETEDAPIFYAAERLKNFGCTVKTICLDKNGNVDLETLEKVINPKTSFLSLSLANGLTGVVHPVEEIIKICREKSIKIHVDLSYAIGKVPCNIDADFLTFSSHVIHGQSGACIYTKREDFFSQNEITSIPLWSQDPIGFKAFSLAVKQAFLFSDKMALDVVRLKKHFEKNILEALPATEILFSKGPCLPNVSVLYFPKTHAEALLYRLNKRGVLATFGGGICQPLFSLIEKANLPSKYRYSALSFALSRYTTKDEVDKAVEVINEEVLTLQALSCDL